jgi:hypothetical protein
MSPHAMRMRDMEDRAQIAVECLQLREREWIVEPCQPRFWKALRDVRQQRGRLGQNAAWSDHGGDRPFGFISE